VLTRGAERDADRARRCQRRALASAADRRRGTAPITATTSPSRYGARPMGTAMTATFEHARPGACPACNAAPAAEHLAELPKDATLMLSLPGIHCAGCISGVEKALNAVPGVRSARVNLTLRRAAVEAEPDVTAEDLRGAGGARATRRMSSTPVSWRRPRPTGGARPADAAGGGVLRDDERDAPVGGRLVGGRGRRRAT
jgi:copper chaperone CopZ